MKNKEYVAMVIAKDEADNAEQKDKKKKTFDKMKELQRFQKIQMGEIPEQAFFSPTNKEEGYANSVTSVTMKKLR